MTLSFSDCPHQFLKLAIGMVLVTPAGGGEVRLSSDGTGVMGITTLANEDRVILRLRQVSER